MTGPKSKTDYPEAIRRVRFYDRENGRYLTFLTNNFLLPALTIAKLYKLRWNVELFFRWIKQNLRIKSFYGTSENAVLITDNYDHESMADDPNRLLLFNL